MPDTKPRRQSTGLWSATLLIALLVNGALCWAAEPLTIKYADLPLEVGTKRILALSGADGKSRGEVIEVVTENFKLGDAALIKIAQFNQGKRTPDIWCVVTPARLQLFAEGATRKPLMTQALPVKIGQTAKGTPEEGEFIVRVDRQEKISVPAGTYDCLVQVLEVNGKPVQTVWNAPGVGVVQIKGSQFTAVLMAIQKPILTATEPNTRLLCNFDSGDPLSSPLFPKGRWHPGYGTGVSNVISSVEIDPTEAAVGTAMSMRWRYHTKGNPWIQTDFLFTGSWQERTDLTIYDSLSFYIKGLKPGGCCFMVHANPVRKGEENFIGIPVEYTTEWKKVTIDLRAAALAKLNLTTAAQISFGCLGTGDHANVVWIDEMTCRLKDASKPQKP